MEWYWWLIIGVIVIISIPIKIKFLRGWNKDKKDDFHEEDN
ncbi:MAG: hypothetical protein ACTJGH_02840 [Peptoniphilaceae bacterium]